MLADRVRRKALLGSQFSGRRTSTALQKLYDPPAGSLEKTRLSHMRARCPGTLSITHYGKIFNSYLDYPGRRALQ